MDGGRDPEPSIEFCHADSLCGPLDPGAEISRLSWDLHGLGDIELL
jgi:hypothetical protein